MARIKCKCGEELSNSANPEIQFKVFSEEEWSGLMDKKINDPIIDIDHPKLEYWKCTNCSRLIMFEDGKDAPIAWYKKEE